MRGRPVVLYDGDCAFCRVCARLLRRLDRGSRLDLLDFNRPEADPLLAALPASERRTALHLANTDGSVHSAGPALRQALASRPGPQPPADCSPARSVASDHSTSVIGSSPPSRHRLGWVERFMLHRHDSLDRHLEP